MSEILRENLKSSKIFTYKFREITIPDSGPITSEIKEINCSKTKTRRKLYGMVYERLVRNDWFLITKKEFDEEINRPRAPKVLLRKAQTKEVTVTKIQAARVDLANIMRRTIISEHAKISIKNRYNQALDSAQMLWLEGKWKDHFILQNYHLYQGNAHNGYSPNTIMVCSRDLKSIFPVAIDGGLITIITAYDPRDSFHGTFNNWFQDHMDVLHLMPRLEDYVRAA